MNFFFRMKSEAENNMIPDVKNELFVAAESVENINAQNFSAENISVENFANENSSAENASVQNLKSENLLNNTENGTFKRI